MSCLAQLALTWARAVVAEGIVSFPDCLAEADLLSPRYEVETLLRVPCDPVE